MSCAAEIPPELLCRPTGLVILTGLDVVYNAIHKAIWDSFCNNRRSDRVPLQFKVFEGDHEYPKCRSKQRTSYEWYIPKGFLKRTWMNKHLTLIPAVVVVFFDMDWDEPMWKEKQMECATRVEIVRNSLQGRGSKVAVVLIQKNAPLPPGEDVVATERAAALCSACELSMKSLYVLPHTDHLLGYVIRLENAFYELSQNYYHNEARKVKAHKDFLNKTTHQLLYIRHQFKIAFCNELKQDTHTAIKHYKQAYGHILELRMNDTNLLEIKTFAGFVNYKICRLSFQHNVPLDSIAQFRKHIDFFKNRSGIAELAFEHSAWMSKQFQVFGDLFDEAIKLGLTAIQTQHPGFYYQQAANHAIARKQLCRGLCKPLATPLTLNPLENLNNLDYYGQRPWRQGHQSIDPSDPLKEKEGTLALQNLELQVDHSWIVIPLLSSAVSQFKKYKSPRMKRYLMVQMGEEYFHAKDYNKSLLMLNKVMWDYRIERWWPLLTFLLQMSLKCAYLTAKVQDYVTTCLELTGRYPGYFCNGKITYLELDQDLLIECTKERELFQNDFPEPEPGLEPSCVDDARALWNSSEAASGIYRIEMQNIIPFVECKGRFMADTFSADTEVEIEIYLRVSCPFPVRFSRLSVLLNYQIYNQYCMVNDGHGISAASEIEGEFGNLYLVPGKTRVYKFSFLPTKDEVGSQLEISTVVLELGTDKRLAVLYWIGAGGDALLPSMTAQSLWPKKIPNSSCEEIHWDLITIKPSTRIVPRRAQLDLKLQHHSPSLLNEFYLIKVIMTNLEATTITDIRCERKSMQPAGDEEPEEATGSFSLGVQDGNDAGLEQTTHVCVDNAEFDGRVVSKRIGIDIGSLEPGQQCSKNAFVKCLDIGTRTIFAKIDYSVKVKAVQQSITCTCCKEDTFTLTTVTPFEVSTKTMSVKFETVESAYIGEPFLVIQELRCTAPGPIQIKTSQLQLITPVKNVDESPESQLEEVSLKKSECATECLCLSVPASEPVTVALGKYVLHWRRKPVDNGVDLPYVTTTFPLPLVNVEFIPISVGLKLPAFGNVKLLLPLNYKISNKTDFIQELEAVMEPSDSFMFSGNKQVHFRVPPKSDYSLTYNLFPLIPGHVALPKLHISLTENSADLDEVLQKLLPSYIFIKPTGKTMSMPA